MSCVKFIGHNACSGGQCNDRLDVGRDRAAGSLRGRPDFKVPAAPGVSGYTPEPLTTSTTAAATPDGGAQHFVRALDLPGEWWTLFH